MIKTAWQYLKFSNYHGKKMMQFHNILKETPKYESCIEDSLSYWQMFHHKTDIYCGHQSYQERSQILSLETLKCHLGTLILI